LTSSRQTYLGPYGEMYVWYVRCVVWVRSGRQTRDWECPYEGMLESCSRATEGRRPVDVGSGKLHKCRSIESWEALKVKLLSGEHEPWRTLFVLAAQAMPQRTLVYPYPLSDTTHKDATSIQFSLMGGYGFSRAQPGKLTNSSHQHSLDKKMPPAHVESENHPRFWSPNVDATAVVRRHGRAMILPSAQQKRLSLCPKLY